MNLIDKSYLHPVLRPGYDDVEGIFNFDLGEGVNVGADKYIINIAAMFENVSIEELIASGKAKIYVFVHCKANFFRKAIEIKSFTERIEIPVSDLSGLVELTIVVSAAARMKYRNITQHSDYANAEFPIECGDILAISETNTFIAEKEFDSLQKVESIISVIANENLQRNDPLTIDWSNDKIKVAISKIVFEDYKRLKNARMVTKTLETTIFLPILVSILSDWRHDPATYEDEYKAFRWFRAIHARAVDLNIVDDIRKGIQSPFVLAQKLLDAPISRCLDEVMKKWESLGEGDEL